MKIMACFLSFLCLILNLSLFINLKPPANFYFVIFQLVATAFAPILIICGITGAILGWFSNSRAALFSGFAGAVISLIYMFLITSPSTGFVDAFGKDWEKRLSPTRQTHLLQSRWQPLLPQTPEPVFEQNKSFWKIPGSDRELLCDVWQPAEGVERSGLAVIFFHGSAWYFLDKDTGTRTMFRQLTAQGHVVMDVAYRLTPEVDIYGMVGDVKRAISWMKENANQYRIDPERIVLGGGSAGGHLALLAAYTPENPRLNPEDLQGKDLSVHAVFSFYGPTDLAACYEHLDQKRLIGMPKVAIGQPGAATMEKDMKDAGRLDMLLGGHLHEVPDVYALASPVTHVSPGSPPTLLIQGEPDVITPVSATHQLRERLAENGIPVVNIIYPLTNHAFDLLLPEISPSAQSAFFELERFLELII
jgi:acetyl esterase/lipase